MRNRPFNLSSPGLVLLFRRDNRVYCIMWHVVVNFLSIIYEFLIFKYGTVMLILIFWIPLFLGIDDGGCNMNCNRGIDQY
jgi:hypothetical protein